MYSAKVRESIDTDVKCIHCGSSCDEDIVIEKNLYFCCTGCQSVYRILHDSDLEQYYCSIESPGTKRLIKAAQYPALDKPELARYFIIYQDDSIVKGSFYLPAIHCSSCIWLLEHLSKINPGIVHSAVNFTTKRIYFTFNTETVTIRQVAELLSSIGYEPQIEFDRVEFKEKSSKTELIQLGIVGFCFANIMLLSFPEYLGMDRVSDPILIRVFRFLNIALSVPVLIIAGKTFIYSAYTALRQKFANIDLAVTLAILVTFFRSIYDILNDIGLGYLDSMSGIVFFMLLGRYLQDKTYSNLQFNRKVESFFPISVDVLEQGDVVQSKYIQDVKKGEVLYVRRGEVIPIDGQIIEGDSRIDYSFITGESKPVTAKLDTLIYAGGKVLTNAIKILVTKPFSQSDFVQLWSGDSFKNERQNKSKWTDRIAAYFTVGVILIALFAFAYWWQIDRSLALNSFTAVLIVACPCALLLSSTYTLGFMAQKLSMAGFFVKHTSAIERLAEIDHIIFDKTGTLTVSDDAEVILAYASWDPWEKNAALSLINQSMHPLSHAIIKFEKKFIKYEILSWNEIGGSGLEGWVNDLYIKIGSPDFLNQTHTQISASEVIISIDGVLKAKYEVYNTIKPKVVQMVNSLQKYDLSLLSGDTDRLQDELKTVFPSNMGFSFFQSPQQKLDYVKSRQNLGEKVLMIGDGLNDAGALKQSDVGIAVVNHYSAFAPACDVILNTKHVSQLEVFLQTCKNSKRLIYISFIYSLIYNSIGIYFGVTGTLQPVIAAILMPLSSIGVIFISYIGSHLISKPLVNS